MTMLTIKEVKNKVEQRKKMVEYLHAIVPELRQVASTLKLTRKINDTLNKRDKDKLDAIIKYYQAQYTVNAYLSVDKYSITLHARYSSISKSVVIHDTAARYDDIQTSYVAYTTAQLVSALKRKEEIKQTIRDLNSEKCRLLFDYDLSDYDFYHNETRD